MSRTYDLYINANDRIAGLPNEYVVELPPGEAIPSEYNQVSLVSVTMRNTMFDLDSTNNVLWLSMTTYDLQSAYIVSPFQVTVPPGTYSYNDLETYLTSAIPSAFAATYPTLGAITVTVTHQDYDQKFKITCTSSYGSAGVWNTDYNNQLISFDWFEVIDQSKEQIANVPNFERTLNYSMGFLYVSYPPYNYPGLLQSEYGSGANNTYLSSDVHTLSKTKVLYLCTDIIEPRVVTTGFTSNPRQILHMVPVGPIDQVSYFETSQNKWHRVNRQGGITQLRVWWLDPDTYARPNFNSTRTQQIICLRFLSE